jgi:phage head maturation protease
VRRLDKIDLWEISIVTFPMLPEARVATVKRRGGELSAAERAANVRLARVLRRGAAIMRAP